MLAFYIRDKLGYQKCRLDHLSGKISLFYLFTKVYIVYMYIIYMCACFECFYQKLNNWNYSVFF